MKIRNQKIDLERIKNLHPFVWLFSNRMATLIFSVIIAIILWFIISITIYPTTPITIAHVPLKVDLTGTSVAADGYSMISCDVEEVTVQIEGNRSQVGNLDAETLVAMPDIPNINTAGTKTLDIVVKSTNGTQFTVKSISPQTVNVKFDKIKTAELPVLPDLSKVESVEGCIINEEAVVVTPATLEVVGPAQVIDQIANASVVIDNTTQISTQTRLVSENLTFCDQKGNVIVVTDNDHLQYEQMRYSVDIPVQYKQGMDIVYQLRNVPSTFDEQFLRDRLTLSADKVTLASSDHSIIDTTEFTLDTISLSDIGLSFSKNYTLDVPEGFENLSNISSVNLKLDATGLAQKEFVVSEINIINAPSSFTYKVVAEQLIVTMVGSEESIAQIDPKQLTVTVDLLNVQQTNNDTTSFSCVPTISCDAYDDVWATGVYKVIVTATKNMGTTTTNG